MKNKPVTITGLPPEKLGSVVDGYVTAGGYVEVRHNMSSNTYVVSVRWDQLADWCIVWLVG